MKDLKEITDNNPFKVPESYFEELNNRIISATAGSETKNKPAGLPYKLRPYLAIAASFLILTLLGYTALRIFLPADKMPEMPEISLLEFSDTYLNEIDILTLEEGITPSAFYDMIPDVTDSEIIDYLIHENIEIDDIYEIL